MSKTRDEYLEKHWTRYPEMPRGALKWGRVEQMRLGINQLADWTFKDCSDIRCASVLVEGDLIAIMPAQQVVLLAPNLTERPARGAQWPEHQNWQAFQVEIRNFFREKRFQEVRTPTLVECPGTEPTLDPFETEFHLGSKKKKYYLPTSPELNLKKLLSEGAERIFEVAPVFRNGEKTERHQPEFTMLEWYRAFAHLTAVKMDVIELIEQMADRLKVERPVEVLSFSMPELFQKYCGFNLAPQTTEQELRELALHLSVDVSGASGIDDYFYLIFMDKIENRWPSDRLVFVEKYPPYQAALARIGSDGWAERFEVYWRGLELGNAFHELNDPKAQRQRAEEDNEKKKKMGKAPVQLDEKFFAALDFGLPPSAGIAMGVERLYLALTQQQNIDTLKRIY